MVLYVVRHGKAQQSAPSDWERTLKPRGERQARWLGERIAVMDQPPELVITSPVVRATQTARLIAECLDASLEEERALQTGAHPSDVMAVVERHAHIDSLMVVGHNPTFDDLVEILSGREQPYLRTGEAVVFAIEPGMPEAELIDRLRMDEE